MVVSGDHSLPTGARSQSHRRPTPTRRLGRNFDLVTWRTYLAMIASKRWRVTDAISKGLGVRDVSLSLFSRERLGDEPFPERLANPHSAHVSREANHLGVDNWDFDGD